jgi:Iron-containing redox enzyme
MMFCDELKNATTAERAFLLASPTIECNPRRDLTHRRYLGFLTEAYHLTRQEVPMLDALAARLRSGRGTALGLAIEEHLHACGSHDEWILNDVAQARGDPEEVRRSVPSVETAAIIAYRWDVITRRNEIGYLGMVFVAEGTATSLAAVAGARLQERLRLPDAAFSYLRSRDIVHTRTYRDLKAILNSLDDRSDRSAIIQAARVMYWLYGNLFIGLHQLFPDEPVSSATGLPGPPSRPDRLRQTSVVSDGVASSPGYARGEGAWSKSN